MTENLLKSSNNSTDRIFTIVSDLIRVSNRTRDSSNLSSREDFIMDDYTSHVDSMLDTISAAFTQRMNHAVKAVNSSSVKQKTHIGMNMTADNFSCLNKPK